MTSPKTGGDLTKSVTTHKPQTLQKGAIFEIGKQAAMKLDVMSIVGEQDKVYLKARCDFISKAITVANILAACLGKIQRFNRFHWIVRLTLMGIWNQKLRLH